MSLFRLIIVKYTLKGVLALAMHDNLVEELARLSPEELAHVLETLEKRLEQEKQLNSAVKIIEKYKPALKELAK